MPVSASARVMARAAKFPIGPIVITARSFPSFSFRPFPTGISSKRTCQVHQYAASTGVADHRERSLVRQLCRIIRQRNSCSSIGELIVRLEIGRKTCHIKSSVMSRTVFANQSGAVETQNNWEILIATSWMILSCARCIKEE